MAQQEGSQQYKARYHWIRRMTQFSMLLLVILIPVLGIFRIDFATASFFIRDLQVEWTNYTFLIGLTLVLFTLPAITYLTIGSVFCGWACPQNLFSELSDGITHKLLGKRAHVRVDGPAMVVAASKNKASNWVMLVAVFMLASAILAYFFLFFFYTGSDMWGFLTGTNRPASIIVMYWITVFFIFIDLATVRYLYCDYPCLYRVWLRFFRNRDALHIAYDDSRSAACEKCNFCAASCITNIQPTAIKNTDTCVDCGECVDACDQLHARSGKRGLLSFKLGEIGSNMTWRKMLTKAFSGFKWLVLVVFMLGWAMMFWGGEIAAQKVADQQKLLQKNERLQKASQICNQQCAAVQASCNATSVKAGDFSGCYRAAACRCNCMLKLDPEDAENNCQKDSEPSKLQSKP